MYLFRFQIFLSKFITDVDYIYFVSGKMTQTEVHDSNRIVLRNFLRNMQNLRGLNINIY